jgi:hypothetical protein
MSLQNEILHETDDKNTNPNLALLMDARLGGRDIGRNPLDDFLAEDCV